MLDNPSTADENSRRKSLGAQRDVCYTRSHRLGLPLLLCTSGLPPIPLSTNLEYDNFKGSLEPYGGLPVGGSTFGLSVQGKGAARNGNIMIEVTIDSIRVSLMSQHRIVVLKEESGARFLPIWIGPFEADAITLQLQGIDAPRPLTHDLLKTVIETLGGEVLHIVISGLEKNTYFARIVLDVDGDTVEVDSRPSDAIALGVRVNAPIYVADEVMEQAGLKPEEEISLEGAAPNRSSQRAVTEEEEEEDLGVFTDFVEGLDLDSLLGN